MRRVRSCTWLVALSLALTACMPRCHATSRARPAPAPFRLGSISAPRAISTPASFDLVATGDGAVLIFAAPLTEGGVLRAMSLDPRGVTRGRETLVADRGASASPLLVTEVTAASAGGRLGIAWLAQESSARAEVFTTHGGTDALAFAPATSLGESVALPQAARGRLAMSAREDGALTLTFRRSAGPCEAQTGTCARYQHRRIGRPEATARGTDGNEVLVPCEPLLPGSVWTNGVWFSGVCSAADGARSHVFAIREEPSYAAVYDGPRGCLPVGLVALADGAAAVTRCAEGLHVARLGADGRATEATTHTVMTTTCEGGRPQLRATGDGVTIALALEAPQSRVEALLPTRLAPAGARAVWTGEALLVAAPQGSDVFLRRYACRPGSMEFVRDDDGA